MSYLLPHLHSGFAVDQAILSVSFLADLLSSGNFTLSHEMHKGRGKVSCWTRH